MSTDSSITTRGAVSAAAPRWSEQDEMAHLEDDIRTGEIKMSELQFVPQKAALSFEHGVLHLLISRKFRQETLDYATLVAEISKEDVKLKYSNRKSSNKNATMTMSAREAELFALGLREVEYYWKDMPLSCGHILLTCGHIIDWDEYCKQRDTDHNGDCHPLGWQVCDHLGAGGQQSIFCFECENETSIHRYNRGDFASVLPYQHVLLECGALASWDELKEYNAHITGDAPRKYDYYQCPMPSHGGHYSYGGFDKKSIIRYNPGDFPVQSETESVSAD